MLLHDNLNINDRGHLEIGGCDCCDLVHEFGTPLYVIDEQKIRKNCRKFNEALKKYYPNSQVVYAAKAFMTMAVCRIIEEEGLGLDVVSGGELFTAIETGFPKEKIYFHGNNKSFSEIKLGVKSGVGRFVADNFFELEQLNEVGAKYHRNLNVILRITPGVEAHTHEFIKTGQIDSKFGFTLPNGEALLAVGKILKLKHLKLTGLHCHIGSQIFEDEPFKAAAEAMLKLVSEIKDSYNVEINELDIGGGFGIKYVEQDAPIEIEDIIRQLTTHIKCYCKELNIQPPKLIIEPGRAIVGDAGLTLYTVGSIKDIPDVRKYISVDGGMADNIRPPLYGAEYKAVVANKASHDNNQKVSIAGKCCESGDMLIWDAVLPEINSNDIIAVLSTGAYNYSMSSNYNRLPRPAVILVNNGSCDIIVQRETYADLIRNDVVPYRLKKRNVTAL
jgi:diaminopimelate decarboxylase